ncbi:hypothetical protein WN51_07109 [Melipona quadrifasciata]|uniref:Uncharacterized protein n=1 Tax=Melipona quadrifasciata TaxID=166423 RepID=A0A0M8ZQW2_9HYME|nr:hypothetical protein WN51_07109 [Melipona quadrifasciata]
MPECLPVKIGSDGPGSFVRQIDPLVHLGSSMGSLGHADFRRVYHPAVGPYGCAGCYIKAKGGGGHHETGPRHLAEYCTSDSVARSPRIVDEMKSLIVFSALLAAVCARPSLVLSPPVAALAGPVTIARLVPGAPLGLDGRVVDTPEVTLAKAEHAAAHINERINLANEALKSADLIAYAAPVLATRVEPLAAAAKIVPPAPLGPDGRVVDTPEVALAKAEHAAAHINEKLEQAARGVSLQVPIALSYTAPVIQKLLLRYSKNCLNPLINY